MCYVNLYIHCTFHFNIMHHYFYTCTLLVVTPCLSVLYLFIYLFIHMLISYQNPSPFHHHHLLCYQLPQYIRSFHHLLNSILRILESHTINTIVIIVRFFWAVTTTSGEVIGHKRPNALLSDHSSQPEVPSLVNTWRAEAILLAAMKVSSRAESKTIKFGAHD